GGEGAGQHHPFEAHREDAGALREDATERGEQERRCNADGRGQKLDHARRTVAARTNSIVRPSITTTSADGTPIRRCIESDPASSRPTNKDAGTTATGSNAASKATVTALKPKPSE